MSLRDFERQAAEWIAGNVKSGLTRHELVRQLFAARPGLREGLCDLLVEPWVWRVARSLRDAEQLPLLGISPASNIVIDGGAVISRREHWGPDKYIVEVKKHQHIVDAHQRIIAAYYAEYAAKWPDQLELFPTREQRPS